MDHRLPVGVFVSKSPTPLFAYSFFHPSTVRKVKLYAVKLLAKLFLIAFPLVLGKRVFLLRRTVGIGDARVHVNVLLLQVCLLFC